VRTLRALPKLNQHFVGGEFVSIEEIRIAALVKSPLGFVSPTLSASNIDAGEWEENAEAILRAARENRIPAENLQPATTSITDLGEFWHSPGEYPSLPPAELRVQRRGNQSNWR
jgi:pyruvate/2-oxoglutarate dehydrogenase complex dihydrolipoamide acyltransferase (E2) component